MRIHGRSLRRAKRAVQCEGGACRAMGKWRGVGGCAMDVGLARESRRPGAGRETATPMCLAQCT
jgi:hypothetical protein